MHEEMVNQFPVLSSQFSVLSSQFSVTPGYWELRTENRELISAMLSAMWGSARWTAKLLVLVMLAPCFGPLAVACTARPQSTHCMRQPLSGDMAHPAMQCHHAMAQSQPSQPEASPAAFRAGDDCCANHHCCCGATTSEWARPASSLRSCLSFAIETTQPSQAALLFSSDIFGPDSARAPPSS
jgi:hypothetical protein